MRALTSCLGRVKETELKLELGRALQAQLSRPQGVVGHPKWEHTSLSIPNRKASLLLIRQEEESFPPLPTAQPIRDRRGPAPRSLLTLDPQLLQWTLVITAPPSSPFCLE